MEGWVYEHGAVWLTAEQYRRRWEHRDHQLRHLPIRWWSDQTPRLKQMAAAELPPA